MIEGDAPVTATNGRKRSPRMSRRDRRRQLLDVTAALLASEGTRAVTMERVAELAGVSKALPYAHFANADELLVAVYQRSSVRLGRTIWESLTEAAQDPDADLAAVWIDAHFRHGAGQGEVFGALIQPGSAIPSIANRESGGEDFTGRVLHRFFDVDVPTAKAVAGIILGAIVGASHTWLRGDGDRAAIERALVEMIHGVVVAAGGRARTATDLTGATA